MLLSMLVGFQLLIFSMSTAQWMLLLRSAGVKAGAGEAFFAKLGGVSVNYVSLPIAAGGEVVRAGLIKKKSSGYGKVSATIAADKAIEIGTRLPAVAVGLFLISALAAKDSLLRPLGAGIAVLLVAVVAAGIVLLKRPLSTCDDYRGLHPGGTRRHPVLAAAQRLMPRLAARAAHGLSEFRASLNLVLARKKLLFGAVLFGFSASLIDVLQLSVLLYELGLTLSGAGLVMYAGSALQGSVAFLPGNVGGMEATSMFVFKILGADPGSGIVYALLLRAAQLVWNGVGLGYLAFRALRGRLG
jgi:uncharacterized protein (TIRG00374 family)